MSARRQSSRSEDFTCVVGNTKTGGAPPVALNIPLGPQIPSKTPGTPEKTREEQDPHAKHGVEAEEVESGTNTVDQVEAEVVMEAIELFSDIDVRNYLEWCLSDPLVYVYCRVYMLMLVMCSYKEMTPEEGAQMMEDFYSSISEYDRFENSTNQAERDGLSSSEPPMPITAERWVEKARNSRLRVTSVSATIASAKSTNAPTGRPKRSLPDTSNSRVQPLSREETVQCAEFAANKSNVSWPKHVKDKMAGNWTRLCNAIFLARSAPLQMGVTSLAVAFNYGATHKFFIAIFSSLVAPQFQPIAHILLTMFSVALLAMSTNTKVLDITEDEERAYMKKLLNNTTLTTPSMRMLPLWLPAIAMTFGVFHTKVNKTQIDRVYGKQSDWANWWWGLSGCFRKRRLNEPIPKEEIMPDWELCRPLLDVLFGRRNDEAASKYKRHRYNSHVSGQKADAGPHLFFGHLLYMELIPRLGSMVQLFTATDAEFRDKMKWLGMENMTDTPQMTGLQQFEVGWNAFLGPLASTVASGIQNSGNSFLKKNIVQCLYVHEHLSKTKQRANQNTTNAKNAEDAANAAEKAAKDTKDAAEDAANAAEKAEAAANKAEAAAEKAAEGAANAAARAANKAEAAAEKAANKKKDKDAAEKAAKAAEKAAKDAAKKAAEAAEAAKCYQSKETNLYTGMLKDDKTVETKDIERVVSAYQNGMTIGRSNPKEDYMVDVNKIKIGVDMFEDVETKLYRGELVRLIEAVFGDKEEQKKDPKKGKYKTGEIGVWKCFQTLLSQLSAMKSGYPSDISSYYLFRTMSDALDVFRLFKVEEGGKSYVDSADNLYTALKTKRQSIIFYEDFEGVKWADSLESKRNNAIRNSNTRNIHNGKDSRTNDEEVEDSGTNDEEVEDSSANDEEVEDSSANDEEDEDSSMFS